LQALALVAPAREVEPAAIQGSVQMAATALERLEREINGSSLAPGRAPLSVAPLLEAAVGRQRARAALAGRSLALARPLEGATIEGDRGELAQALDNLIVNAIEHGGPEIVVAARSVEERLRVTVADSGREARPDSRRERPAELIARLCGRRLHGHGLRVVRRIAASHGGHFQLRSSAGGTEAVLELPLARHGRGEA
jgi:signal transduction histidine kinase